VRHNHTLILWEDGTALLWIIVVNADSFVECKHSSYPHADSEDRSRPVYQDKSSQWRALNKGEPAPPSAAFSYISRAFRQTTPHIIGALVLLANSYEPQAINKSAWALYAEFRPTVDEWGKRGEVKCDTILRLRPQNSLKRDLQGTTCAPEIKFEDKSREDVHTSAQDSDVEKYEAELDKDHTFDDIDLSQFDSVS
jgi:hypothetical protein